MVKNNIFNIKSKDEFETLALSVFRKQYQDIPIYNSFCNHLGRTPETVQQLTNIPFLPIQFFKSHKIAPKSKVAELVFSSSGTTGSVVSKHYVTDALMYTDSYQKGFFNFYGAIKDYVVLALLPSYLERKGSSLIYMVEDLIKQTENENSGFYLDDTDKLAKKILELDTAGQKILLIGVSFALLDFVEAHKFQLQNTIVMETGGMKGRRKEMIRTELHEILCEGFGVSGIHSEYGMTELLSQGYAKKNGIFECPPWMQVRIRDTEDPLTLLDVGKTGGLNIIDLANINSCAFIATQDLGKQYKDGSFEVLGRFDDSDIRGCNLMAL